MLDMFKRLCIGSEEIPTTTTKGENSKNGWQAQRHSDNQAGGHCVKRFLIHWIERKGGQDYLSIYLSI